MYSIPASSRKKTYLQHLNYRRYSRQIMRQPMNMDIHTSRIMTAMELDEKEPLQGALADMFYGCWFDVPFFGERMLNQVKEKLNLQIIQSFQSYVKKAEYIQNSTPLATRWSVLVSPSMQVYSHQLRITSDDSRVVAEQIVSALMDVLEDEDDEALRDQQIHEIEQEFFTHCTACNDRLAFSIVWWQLAKNNWVFHEGWTNCRQQFEEKFTNQTMQKS